MRGKREQAAHAAPSKSQHREQVGRTLYDALLDRRLQLILLILALLVIFLSSLGVIDLRIRGRDVEFQTHPLRNVRGDPVFVKVIDPAGSRAINQVYVPTFTATLVNYGGPTDGKYLDGLADIFATKLSPLYDARTIPFSPDEESNIEAAALRMVAGLAQTDSFGVLIGRVHKYQNERPDIGQKAMVSMTISLYDNRGRRLWIASQTLASSSTFWPGDKVLGGMEAIELTERLSTEMTQRLQQLIVDQRNQR